MAATWKDAATKSKATTSVGLAGGVALAWSHIQPLLDGNAETGVDWSLTWLVPALSMILLGLFSRDHGVSSEAAGAHTS